MFKKHKFSSTDNIDEIVDQSLDEDVGQDVVEKKQEQKIIPKEEEYKSDTNTVNSNEFREYLRKKGLSLFPAKPKEANTDHVDNAKADKIIVSPNDKKKTVFRRLSSIFSKNKTSPKQNETKARLSFSEKGENNRSSADKRLIIARSKYQSDDNGPILANNEFLTSQNFLVGKHVGSKSRDKSYDSDDKRSSISSVLTAAADEDSVIETPSVRRKNNPSLYRSIDFNRSKLFKDGPKSQLNSDIKIEQPVYLNRVQAPYKDPRSSLRKSNDYEFQPVKTIPHQTNYFPASSTPIKATNQNVPQAPRQSNGTPAFNMRSGIDPFTFAKIHEIKRKTDRVFQNDNQNDKNQFNNSNFVRNSNVRSSDNAPNAGVRRLENLHATSISPHPQRSQSVLDNMTCFQNSLYGEVTYRQPNGANVNVMMRRPSSSTLDRKQIMDKIYEYYRKSVNNTPVSYQENSNLYQKSQSTNNPHNRSLNDTPTYWQPYVRGSIDRSNRPVKIMENFSHIPVRKQKLSESEDSEFPLESISSMDNYPRYSMKSYTTSGSKPSTNEAARIYDVVNQSPRDALYGYINRQRNTPSIPSPSPLPTSQRRGIPIATRPTPILAQSPALLSSEMDIIYNNKIYRPIATIQPNRLPQTESSQNVYQHKTDSANRKDSRLSANSNRPENVEFRRTLLSKRRKYQASLH